MVTVAFFIALVILGRVLYFGTQWLIEACSKYSGNRVVTCPETSRPALVEIDVRHATLTSIAGRPDIRMESCSRWPLKNQCGQECLANFDMAPGECLVSGVVKKWYRGRDCIYCGKPAEELQWIEHKPFLQTPERELAEGSGAPVANLPMVLKTHLPVCWKCYAVHSFRKDQPVQLIYPTWQQTVSGQRHASRRPRGVESQRSL